MPSRSKKNQAKRLRRKWLHADAVASETYLGRDEFGFDHYLGKPILIHRDSDTLPAGEDRADGLRAEQG